ncbi:MFS transporter [Streptomyces sp. NPDC058401]|uniref:MFS transporter n=1 Tax=Streptomyces sp. NPDC058401 TaxID=3346480 RepID=UPI003647F15E
MLASASLARLAGRIFVFAIILFTLDRFQSAEIAGWAAFASVAPGLLISPVAGALLDRVGAARSIALDISLSAATLGVLVATSLMDALSVPLLLALMVVFSSTNPLSAAGIRVLLPRLAPEHALDRINAIDMSSYSCIDVLGPLLGGLLYAAVGGENTLLVVAVLYAGAVVSMLPIVRRTASDPAPAGSAQTGLLQASLAGLLYVVKHRTLRGLAMSYSLYQVSWGVLAVAVPVFVRERTADLAHADSMNGLLWSVAGVAGACGALLIGHLRTDDRERRFIILGTLATAIAIFPISVSGGLIGLGVGMALVGLLEGGVNVGVLSLRHRRTDPEQLGRVLAVSISLNMSGLPVGSAIAGMLVGSSVNSAFLVGGVAALLAAVSARFLIPEGSKS